MVHRRTVLAALGSTTLAGCAGTIHLPVDTSPRTLTELTTNFDSSDISFSGRIVQSEISPDQTAQFVLDVQWEGDEPTRIAFGNYIPFSYPQQSTSPKGLALFPEEKMPEREDQKTWVPVTSSSNFLLYSPHFEPGEEISRTWTVWADRKRANRVAPGDYQFRGTVEVGDHPENDGHQNQGENEQTIEWSLNLVIES
jgi:hypothetical protein